VTWLTSISGSGDSVKVVLIGFLSEVRWARRSPGRADPGDSGSVARRAGPATSR
jgi:hypothetical protein